MRRKKKKISVSGASSLPASVRAPSLPILRFREMISEMVGFEVLKINSLFPRPSPLWTATPPQAAHARLPAGSVRQHGGERMVLRAVTLELFSKQYCTPTK